MLCRIGDNTIPKTQTGRIFFFGIFSILAIVFLCSIETNSEELNKYPLLPEELLSYADQKGYGQVSDFYENRPGMLNPPYTYGVLVGAKEDSAAFWVERIENNKKKYFLIFMIKNKKDKEVCDCPEIIEWPNFPGGLSVFSRPGTPLDDFYYIDKPKKKVEPGAQMQSRGVLSEYDGVESLFYCYNGKWVVRTRH